MLHRYLMDKAWIVHEKCMKNVWEFKQKRGVIMKGKIIGNGFI